MRTERGAAGNAAEPASRVQRPTGGPAGNRRGTSARALSAPIGRLAAADCTVFPVASAGRCGATDVGGA
jgi:hypothetical protein